MRYLVCLIAGLFLGALAASMAVNAVARRHAWPRAVMNVMQHELGDARSAAHEKRCQLPATREAAAHLRLLANDIEPALLPPGVKDPVFAKYTSDLRDALARWNTDADCARQGEALSAVAHTCDACHRDYR